MKGILMVALLACGLYLLVPTGALAQDLHDEDTMGCGDQIVNIGNTKYQVQTKCGIPADVEYAANTWVYNFGPDKFVYYVTFVDDLVVRLQSDGYGTEGAAPIRRGTPQGSE